MTEDVMKKSIALILALVLALSVFALAGCNEKPNENPTDAPVDVPVDEAGSTAAPEAPVVENTESLATLRTGTGSTTGTYYAFTSAVAQILATDSYNFEVISTGGSQANIEGIEDGDYDFAIVQNDVMNYAYTGTNVFTTPITAFSAIGCVYPEVCQLIATEKSGIKSVADLKGKTVAIGDVGSGTYYNAIQIIEAGGLDPENDISSVYASFGDSATQLKDGSIDAAFITAGTPTTAITELATTTNVVVVDLGDELIAKLIEAYPFYATYDVTSDDYDFVTETVKTVAIMATYIVSNEVPTEQVYEITKNLWEKQAEIAEVHVKGAEMDKSIAVTSCGNVPLHPGAEQYYKEIGVIA